ncbi:unnamed protein product [Sphacelaria rigidula]
MKRIVAGSRLRDGNDPKGGSARISVKEHDLELFLTSCPSMERGYIVVSQNSTARPTRKATTESLAIKGKVNTTEGRRGTKTRQKLDIPVLPFVLCGPADAPTYIPRRTCRLASRIYGVATFTHCYNTSKTHIVRAICAAYLSYTGLKLPPRLQVGPG